MTSERVANTGAVSAQVFMDENADGIMNENETPLEGVTLNNKSYTTDEDGLAFIPRMQVFQPTQVRVDKASVAGMGATPKEKAYAVVSRPGITTKLDYPVVPTLEIEGKAYLDTADRQVEYPGLMLELVNSDGEVVREVRTEFDGYYYLDDVYPGQYTLRVAEKEVESKNLLAKSYDIDTTTLRDKGEYEGFVGGYDFMVARADSPTPVDMPETMVADVEEAPQESGQAEERVATLPEAAIPQPETAQTALPAAEPAATVENIMPPKTADNIRVDTPVAAAKIPATPTSPEEERNVFVQAGMYCDYTNAQRQVDTLTIAGFNASLKGRSFKGQSCYLVHVGPAQDLAAAEMITQELQDMGLEKPIIVEENAQLYE
jgi:cell division septation protein DedD